MKSSYLRAGAALACTLALSACGGSDGDMLLQARVFGVTKPSLVLQNNGGSDLTLERSGSFYFDNLIPADDEYNVTVKSVPPNVEECIVHNGKGRAVFSVNTVEVECIIKTHALEGSITGLGNATGLVLVNGSDRREIPAGATSFAMAKVGEDAPYGITILQQPAGLACSVLGGIGTMGTDDIRTVQVNCVPAA